MFAFTCFFFIKCFRNAVLFPFFDAQKLFYLFLYSIKNTTFLKKMKTFLKEMKIRRKITQITFNLTVHWKLTWKYFSNQLLVFKISPLLVKFNVIWVIKKVIQSKKKRDWTQERKNKTVYFPPQFSKISRKQNSFLQGKFSHTHHTHPTTSQNSLICKPRISQGPVVLLNLSTTQKIGLEIRSSLT